MTSFKSENTLKALALALSLSIAPGLAIATDTTKTDVGEAVVTTQIKAEMVKNKTLNAFDIEVDTEDSSVVLSGSVKTNLEKAEAERVARSVKGVTTVKNNIVVNPNL